MKINNKHLCTETTVKASSLFSVFWSMFLMGIGHILCNEFMRKGEESRIYIGVLHWRGGVLKKSKNFTIHNT